MAKVRRLAAGYVNNHDPERHQDGEIALGTRIYYTGDMANSAKWGTATGENAGGVLVEYDNGASTVVFPQAIGKVYRGHCDPRFVTEAAYTTWRKQQVSQFQQLLPGGEG